GHGPAATLAGAALVIAAILLALRHVGRLASRYEGRAYDAVMVLLLGFSLLYAAAAAIGRVCFGVEYAQSSRYSLHLFPALLAFYFALAAKAAGKGDRKSTRLNSSHRTISYAVFCLKKTKEILC